MSTLKVASINNPSAPSGGLAISATGLVSGTGLDLIASQSFTAASSVSVNNCFSSTYENYRIIVRATTSTTSTVNIRVRAGGSDNSAAVHSWENLIAAAGASGNRATGATYLELGQVNSSVGVFNIEVNSPFLAAETDLISLGKANNGGLCFWNMVGVVNNTTSYDGFTLYPSAGTITGTIRVYGFRN